MSTLPQTQGNPVQEQDDLQQQHQQSSPDTRPQSDDEEQDNAEEQPPLPGDAGPGPDADKEQTDQLRQSQADQQSDAVPEEGDHNRGKQNDNARPADTVAR